MGIREFVASEHANLRAERAARGAEAAEAEEPKTPLEEVLAISKPLLRAVIKQGVGYTEPRKETPPGPGGDIYGPYRVFWRHVRTPFVEVGDGLHLAIRARVEQYTRWENDEDKDYTHEVIEDGSLPIVDYALMARITEDRSSVYASTAPLGIEYAEDSGFTEGQEEARDQETVGLFRRVAEAVSEQYLLTPAAL